MEIVLVLVIVLLVFGPNRLPQMGRNLGRAVREFKKATDSARAELGLDDVINDIRGVRDDLSNDFRDSGVTQAVGDLKTGLGGATQAVGSVTSGLTSALTIDLKSKPAAAVDKPVQVAPPVGDDVWPAAAVAEIIADAPAPEAEPVRVPDA